MKRIALFNHKGGVSKTTTTFNLGWMLASKGHRVILVDADPQCNLSGLILGYKGPDEFERFYEHETGKNIRDGLSPAFESQPRQIEAVDCIAVDKIEGLYLLPGHIRLSEYEVTLGIAQELSSAIQTLQNLPGSLTHLIEITGRKLKADYVLVDMNPGLGSINQNLLMTSDYFLVPTSPDYFSLMALHSLQSILPRWHAWSEEAKQKVVLQQAAYPYPSKTPKFLGTVIQNYRPRGGAPSRGFQSWVNEISQYTANTFFPSLQGLSMTLPHATYRRVKNFEESYCLAQIPDFNTLIAQSQEHRTPVFALPDDKLMSGNAPGGAVLKKVQRKRSEFHDIFSHLADTVLEFTSDATDSSTVSS